MQCNPWQPDPPFADCSLKNAKRQNQASGDDQRDDEDVNVTAVGALLSFFLEGERRKVAHLEKLWCFSVVGFLCWKLLIMTD